MADGKWIPELRPEMPVREASGVALAARLGVVAHFLPRAVNEAASDIEHVHQLRVGTRRAGAALTAFADCIPPKRLRDAKRLLRSIRRAAGEARDWDVFQQELVGAGKKRKPDATVRFLFGFCVARRMAAQEELTQGGPRRSAELSELLADLPDRPHDPAGGAATLGALGLTRLAEAFGELGRATDPLPEGYDALHQVRILGKRLRYAMELFAGCFAAPFRERLYPAVEEMQEILGSANDSHVAAGRLEAIGGHLTAFRPDQAPVYEKRLSALVRAHRQKLASERGRFTVWLPRWKALLAEYPLERLRLLVSPAPRPGRSRSR